MNLGAWRNVKTQRSEAIGADGSQTQASLIRIINLAGSNPAAPYKCAHEWRYARCAEIRGEYICEVKCRHCGKTELL